MRTAILFFLLLRTSCIICNAQNLIVNSDFEYNGQPECQGWYDVCGNDLAYLCAGITDSAFCNRPDYGVQLYNDAPPAGGQWCMSLIPLSSTLRGKMSTFVAGKFLGVYEFKVWMRLDSLGYGGINILPKDSLGYTGFHGVMNNTATFWTQIIVRDTIKYLSDTVFFMFDADVSNFTSPKKTYIDMAEFRMVESWSDVKGINANKEVSVSPNPFSNQLTFSLADNEQTTVLLYNFLGQQVLQQTFTNSTTINTAQLAEGIYFYELRNSKETLKTGKLVKQ